MCEQKKHYKNNSGTETGERTADENPASTPKEYNLVGALAHEIKNPLSTIKINLKLIDEDLKELEAADTDSRQKKLRKPGYNRALRKIEVIHRETDRLEQILDSFLKYADKRKPEKSAADINKIVEDMLDFFSPQAQGHSITIRQNVSREPLMCNIDPQMLKQAILNLLINAQHAMENGGELIIKTRKIQDKAIIEVSDTGTGIPPQQINHIFEPYYSSHSQGSGLGLPTAKKIIEHNEGNIRVVSEPGVGSSFSIELPLQNVK